MKNYPKIEQTLPLLMFVVYHHYKDITVLQVVKTFQDGTSTNEIARSTSKIYGHVERRAFFSEVPRKIQHLIHNCNYN